MEESEDPCGFAALMRYLYTLDYADEGSQMNFGIPAETKSLVDEEDEAEVVEEEQRITTDALDTDVAVVNDDRWHIGDSLSRSPTARDNPSPSHHTNHRDPGKPLSALALHVQMCKTGLRFGIPWLLPLGLKKLKGSIWENLFSNEELIEAASCAWEDYEGG